jgi:nickel transport protein
MKQKHFFSLSVAVFCLLFLAASAWAHKVNIFAYAENGTVYTESYFPDGRPVEGGAINVYDRGGKQLLTGTTDSEGLFSFSPPAQDDLTIEIIASMGHKNSFLLHKEELGDIPVTEPQPDIAPVESGVRQGVPESISPSVQQVESVNGLQKQLNDIAAELRSVKREIAALRASMEKPGLDDIVSGIGYILGLLGVAFFMMNRKKQ